MKFFCLNLRGVTRRRRRLGFQSKPDACAEAAEAMPEPGQPFWIRDFRGWEANWATHLGTTGVFIDGLDVFRSDVAIWRSIMDGSGFRRMTSKDMRVNDIHNPLSMGFPEESDYANENASEGAVPRTRGERIGWGAFSSFRDEMPPVTVITRTCVTETLCKYAARSQDTSDVKRCNRQ